MGRSGWTAPRPLLLKLFALEEIVAVVPLVVVVVVVVVLEVLVVVASVTMLVPAVTGDDGLEGVRNAFMLVADTCPEGKR